MYNTCKFSSWSDCGVGFKSQWSVQPFPGCGDWMAESNACKALLLGSESPRLQRTECFIGKVYISLVRRRYDSLNSNQTCFRKYTLIQMQSPAMINLFTGQISSFSQRQ